MSLNDITVGSIRIFTTITNAIIVDITVGIISIFTAIANDH